MINIIQDENKINEMEYPEILPSNCLVENNENIEIFELISLMIKKQINNKYFFSAFIKDNLSEKWFLHDESGIKELDKKEKNFNELNAIFLIYQKKKN